MVVHEHSLVLSGLPSAPNDQPQLGKFIDGSDHDFTLHTCLCGNVIVAVPAIANLCAVGFAEEQIDQHLTWDELPEDMPVHKKPTAVK